MAVLSRFLLFVGPSYHFVPACLIWLKDAAAPICEVTCKNRNASPANNGGVTYSNRWEVLTFGKAIVVGLGVAFLSSYSTHTYAQSWVTQVNDACAAAQADD